MAQLLFVIKFSINVVPRPSRDTAVLVLKIGEHAFAGRKMQLRLRTPSIRSWGFRPVRL